MAPLAATIVSIDDVRVVPITRTTRRLPLAATTVSIVDVRVVHHCSGCLLLVFFVPLATKETKNTTRTRRKQPKEKHGRSINQPKTKEKEANGWPDSRQ
jgi:hypothetical protein